MTDNDDAAWKASMVAACTDLIDGAILAGPDHQVFLQRAFMRTAEVLAEISRVQQEAREQITKETATEILAIDEDVRREGPGT